MKELTVFYCPHCGYYGYYLLPKRAVCPSCSIQMTQLPLSCQQFMELDYSMRDQLIGSQIFEGAEPHSSVVQRIAEQAKRFNSRAVIAGQAETIQKLKQEIEELKEENRKLSDTVAWMHDTIWKLTRGEDSKSGI